jgi:hypothetical protein
MDLIFETPGPTPEEESLEEPTSDRSSDLRVRQALRDDLADVHELLRAVLPAAGVERPLPTWGEHWYGSASTYWVARRGRRLMAAAHTVRLPVVWPGQPGAEVVSLGYLAAEEARCLGRVIAAVQSWSEESGAMAMLLWDSTAASGRAPTGWHRLPQPRYLISAAQVAQAVSASLAPDPAVVRMSPATLADLEHLRRFYEGAYGQLPITVRRSAVYWSGQLLWERNAPRSARREWLVWVLRMEGEVHGYLRTRRGPDLGLQVLEAGADSEAAYRALARFLVRNARGSLRLALPQGHPLLSMPPLSDGLTEESPEPLYALWLTDSTAPAGAFLAPCDRT